MLLGILRRVTGSIVAYFAERKGRLFLGLLGLQLDLKCVSRFGQPDDVHAEPTSISGARAKR